MADQHAGCGVRSFWGVNWKSMNSRLTGCNNSAIKSFAAQIPSAANLGGRMESTSQPETIFHSSLPIGTSLLVVFIPSKDRDEDPIDQDYWVDEILKTLARLYRGSTAYPRGRGVWRDDERDGVLIMEEPVIVFSYIPSAALTTASLEELYRRLSRMGRVTNQGEVGVVLDGRYYGITNYAEE
jgi:hypothetical protein